MSIQAKPRTEGEKERELKALITKNTKERGKKRREDYLLLVTTSQFSIFVFLYLWAYVWTLRLMLVKVYCYLSFGLIACSSFLFWFCYFFIRSMINISLCIYAFLYLVYFLTRASKYFSKLKTTNKHLFSTTNYEVLNFPLHPEIHRHTFSNSWRIK